MENLYQSVNFKFFERRSARTACRRYPQHVVRTPTGSTRAMVGSRRLEEIHGHRLATTSASERGEERGWRREVSRRAHSRALRVRWSSPWTTPWPNSSPQVRANYRALARYRLHMNVQRLFLRRVFSSTGKLMAVAAAEEDKENISHVPCSADGSSSGSFNNTGAVSNSSCPWTKPIGSFPSEAAHERVVYIVIYVCKHNNTCNYTCICNMLCMQMVTFAVLCCAIKLCAMHPQAVFFPVQNFSSTCTQRRCSLVACRQTSVQVCMHVYSYAHLGLLAMHHMWWKYNV